MPVRKTTSAIRWLLRPFLVQKRQYWRIVLVCFLAAATFWILNALNQEHTTRIAYPVKVMYDSRTLIPLQPLPTQVTLNVTGKGWNLLRRQLGFTESRPAVVRVQNPPETTYLTAQTIAPAIRKEMRGLILNYVTTDTLTVRFDRKVTREVKLQIDSTSLHLAPGYRINSPIVILPAAVTLTGPAFLVDTLAPSILLALPRKTIKTDFAETLTLPPLRHPLVKADISQAHVRFKVARQLVPDSVANKKNF